MTEIRPLRPSDRAQWSALWAGYLKFYRHRLPDEITNHAFARLVDPKARLHGLVAELDGKVVGFVHYQFHPSTWALRDYCYLEDLYVDPTARGHGVGRALIQAVYKDADQAKAATVYWLT